ncbi:MAG: DNA repair exonuclease [Deltaproteobacteria bacterium]|nr:DNA repair exonuclease [Deltaproteobacteria bacterium]
MFKFIHAADIHLDSPLHKLDSYEGAPQDEIRQATRRAFENLVQTAISAKVDFILIGGDLYDGDWKDYNTGLYLVSQTIRLCDAGIPVYIVAGNHDAASKITKKLRLPPNVHLFAADKPATLSIEGLKVAIHGQSFAKPAVKKDLSTDYPAPLSGYFNIGVLHTCASGRPGHEPYAPCSPDGLQSKGYDYWALGHVHQHEILLDNPPIVFSGCIQGRHIRETGPKGCVLVRVDDNGRPAPDFKPLDVIRWSIAEVDPSGAVSAYDVVDRIRRRLEELMNENEGIPLVVRVLVKGETPAHTELLTNVDQWCNETRSAAMDAGGGRIWLEKIKFHTSLPASEKDLQQSDGAIGELLTLFDEMAADPEVLNLLSEEFIEIEKKIPQELKQGADNFNFNDPDWLGGMLKQVRPMLLQRLMRKGASK